MDVRKELQALGFDHVGALRPAAFGNGCEADLPLEVAGYTIWVFVAEDEIKMVGSTGRKAATLRTRMQQCVSTINAILLRGLYLDATEPFKRLAPKVIAANEQIDVWAKESTADTHEIEKQELISHYHPTWRANRHGERPRHANDVPASRAAAAVIREQASSINDPRFSWPRTVEGLLVETITRPAALVRQGSLKLYATCLKVSDLKLPHFYTIKKLDPDGAGPGYQRLLNEGRAKRLAQYLLDGQGEQDAFLPTSIFLATNKDIPFDSSTNTITFEVGQVGPFNVVDGQHRIAGLVMAADENPELLEFEIPVNIGVNLDDISQMCHFLIVNTTQRSVDKSIEQQIVARLTKMVGLEKTPTIPRWIRRQVEKGEDARALAVANFLNTDSGSPWQGKIRMANDESEGATINQKSFIGSLKKYIFSANNPLSNPVWDLNRPMILSNYWKAIVELLVDGQVTAPSVIYKTNGVDLFHIVSATVFTHLAARTDFTKDTIKVLLKKGFANLPDESIAMSHPEWWQRGGVASGLNTAAVRKLANALSHALNVQDNAGTISL